MTVTYGMDTECISAISKSFLTMGLKSVDSYDTLQFSFPIKVAIEPRRSPRARAAASLHAKIFKFALSRV